MELRSKLQKVSHVWMWDETFQAEEIALAEALLRAWTVWGQRGGRCDWSRVSEKESGSRRGRGEGRDQTMQSLLNAMDCHWMG